MSTSTSTPSYEKHTLKSPSCCHLQHQSTSLLVHPRLEAVLDRYSERPGRLAQEEIARPSSQAAGSTHKTSTDVGIVVTSGITFISRQPRLGGERQWAVDKLQRGGTAGRGLPEGRLHAVCCGSLLCACPGAGICCVLCPSLCRMCLRLLSLHSFRSISSCRARGKGWAPSTHTTALCWSGWEMTSHMMLSGYSARTS